MLFVEQLQTQRQGRQFEFSLRLQPGEIGLLLGRSGSGKSTLLEMLAGFVPLTAGTLLADGQNIAALPPAARPFTMLFQQHNLFEHLTVRQNIGLVLLPTFSLPASSPDAKQGQVLKRVHPATDTVCVAPDNELAQHAVVARQKAMSVNDQAVR